MKAAGIVLTREMDQLTAALVDLTESRGAKESSNAGT
jgi:hypothetical protein